MTRFAKLLLISIVILAIAGWWTLSVLRAARLSEGAARSIAATSMCALSGAVNENGTRNANTKTWWFGLAVRDELSRPGCSPACVVSETTHTAEINWRCTGLATTTTNDLIRVTSPIPEATTTSPLTITGEARGTWYFEASFPISVVDEAGTVLGIGHAEAQSDWMTENFVPFKLGLKFPAPETDTGFLVLEKDNPSGLPENADEIRIPVRFR